MTDIATSTIEITGVRIRPAVVPLRRTLNTRVGRFSSGPFLLIDLDLKGGGAGRALCFTFMALAQKLVPVLIEELVASLEGRKISFAEASAVHDACEKRLSHMGHEGLTKMALSMFDMALHDALAREAGVPLYRLLGGRAEPLPTYNSCGLGIMEPADAAREARELVAEHGGFAHVKLRMGREHAREEVAAYRAVREAVGPDIAISVDFNQGLTTATALDTCRAIDGLGLAWIEEPIVYDDYDSQARLATQARHADPGRRELVELARRQGGDRDGCLRLRDAGPAAHRRRHRLDAARPRGRGPRRPLLLPSLARLLRPCARRHADPPLARVHGLGAGPDRRPSGAGERLHHAPRHPRHRHRMEREGHRPLPGVTGRRPAFVCLDPARVHGQSGAVFVPEAPMLVEAGNQESR